MQNKAGSRKNAAQTMPSGTCSTTSCCERHPRACGCPRAKGSCAANGGSDVAAVTSAIAAAAATNTSGAVRLLFVSGLPRSGTTLVESFVTSHAGTVSLAGKDGNAKKPTHEWRPRGSLDYGGSTNCLLDMCGEYLSGDSRRDVRRWDIAAYLKRGREVMRWRTHAADGADGVLLVVKDPALMLLIPQLRRACAVARAHCSFLMVSREPEHWKYSKYPCAGPCRQMIVSNAERCYHRLSSTALNASDVHVVRYEALNQVDTWRAAERWLRLPPVSISFVGTAPPPARARRRRRLMFHKARAGVDSTAPACGAVAASPCVSSVAGLAPSVTVDLKYISGRCTAAAESAALRRFGAEPPRKGRKLSREAHGCSCQYVAE